MPKMPGMLKVPKMLFLKTFIIFLVFNSECSTNNVKLPGFTESEFYNEQVVTFNYYPDIRVHINAPAKDIFDKSKPVGLVLYALPNGNTIEQTVGKVMQPDDDWHYDIQHIGAQTRFLRKKITVFNLVVIYLEAKSKSWPHWKSQHADYTDILRALVDYLRSYFKEFNPFFILSGHSGGGRFIFSYMDAFPEIPDEVKRICFLDSNYGYEKKYGKQLIEWLDRSQENHLVVLAYNDSIALYKGKPFVSDTGGTWYRSKMMVKDFSKKYTFNIAEDTSFIRHIALDGRIQILLKKNPGREIYHTLQIERNGFIHSMLCGTSLENTGYTYYADRVYDALIQKEEIKSDKFPVPPRLPYSMPGSSFMQHIKDMDFESREAAILNEFYSGNIPEFLRKPVKITSEFTDANGEKHMLKYKVMPDYLSVGSNHDFCRVPVGPVTAQKAADLFDACLPTRKLVDDIYKHSEIKLEPVPYYPVEDHNEKVYKFVEHNDAIEKQRREAGGKLGQLTAGIKKDIVLSNKIIDPKRKDHVVIYGWHRLNGKAIQPLTNIHINWYVDYSHGARLIDSEIFIDSEVKKIQDVLTDSVLYKLISDEEGIMQNPSYLLKGDN